MLYFNTVWKIIFRNQSVSSHKLPFYNINLLKYSQKIEYEKKFICLMIFQGR